jgi:hypothetical protein
MARRATAWARPSPPAPLSSGQGAEAGGRCRFDDSPASAAPSPQGFRAPSAIRKLSTSYLPPRCNVSDPTFVYTLGTGGSTPFRAEPDGCHLPGGGS